MNVPRPLLTRRNPGRLSVLAPILLAPVLLASLAACENGDPNSFAPACVPVGILGDAADYSDYGRFETEPDLSKLVAHGSILGVSGHCSSAANGTQLHTQIGVEMGITRGPATGASTLTVPYFIAVTRNGVVVSKQSLVAQAQFPSNAERVLVRTDPIGFDLPVTRAQPGTSYRIEVGFQLDAAQLAYNRSHLTH